MQLFGSKEILLIFLSLFVVYLVAAMFAADGWVIYRLITGRRVLPAAPLVDRRPVPWGVWTVLLTILIYFAVNLAAFVAYSKVTGRLTPTPAPPPAPPAAATDASRSPADKPALEKGKAASAAVDSGKAKPEQKLKPEGPRGKDHPVADSGGSPAPPAMEFSFTESLAVQAVINVVLLILLPFVLGITSRSPLRDLGLRFDRWWLQAAVGAFAFLAIQPIIFVIQLITTSLWENNAHPLYKMILNEFSPGVAQLAILMAVIVAPVFEEVLFRGIIQSWLVRLGNGRRWETPSVAEIAAIPETEEFIPASLWEPDPAQLTTIINPTLAAQTPPPQLAASNEPTSPYAPPSDAFGRVPPIPIASSEASSPHPSGLAGILVTSLIFAAMHAPQWPAPVALFVLSIVIGYVYHRTGSLIAAICMHATFNGFSTLLLLGFLLVPQSAPDAKKDAKPAISSVVFTIHRESAPSSSEK